MKPMFNYIRGTRQESLIVLGLGIFAFIVATLLIIFNHRGFLFGLALSLYLSSAVQILVGASALKRLPSELERLTRYIDFEVHRLVAEEIPRIESLISELSYWKWLEILTVLAGVGLLIFKVDHEPELQGMGLGFVIQAGFMLGAGIFTLRRTRKFLKYLKSQVF